jgi:hypothetical protein
MIGKSCGHMGQSQAGIRGPYIDDARNLGDLIFQDNDLGAVVDGFVDEEVSISLMAFEGNKDITWGHPAGMVGQALDGNTIISPNIQDLEPLEKVGQTFPLLLVFSRQGDSFETFRLQLMLGKLGEFGELNYRLTKLSALCNLMDIYQFWVLRKRFFWNSVIKSHLPKE